jgi:uncharacterized membrane protein
MELTQLALRVTLAVLFVGIGIVHFVPAPARAMSAIIPPALKRSGFPSSKTLVRFTGMC